VYTATSASLTSAINVVHAIHHTCILILPVGALEASLGCCSTSLPDGWNSNDMLRKMEDLRETIGEVDT